MKTEDHLVTTYNERIGYHQSRIDKLKKKDNFWAVTKLILVLAAFILLIILFPSNQIKALAVFCGLIAIFIVCVFFHEGILRKSKHHKTLIQVNRDEINMMENIFSDSIDCGEQFADYNHNYSTDLDLFGKKSIFHFINRTVTTMGRKFLAQQLKQAANLEEIKKRQEAVNELSNKLDFRQSLRAHGMEIDDTSQKLEALKQFFDEEFYLLNRNGLIALIYIVPSITLALLVSLAWGMPLFIPLAFILLQMTVIKITEKKISRFYRLCSKNYKILNAYAKIIRDIEDETFKATKLADLKKALLLKDQKASSTIKRLSTIFEWFEARHSGVFQVILNGILFWDLHCVFRLEKWKKDTVSVVDEWFRVIGEVEALCSFANVYYNNPDWLLPTVHESGFILKARHAGHPLIPVSERVCNDVDISKSGSIRIITGPNMAGKSTFLRTVGVNAVLALAGGPVCAKEFEISVFKMYTSMKSSDSLDKHLSLFYAELQRLKLILDGIRGGEPVFFIIDEMLKGTNTLDRQKGSIVLLKQLIRAGSTGIVATHDLELTRLQEWGNNAGGDVANCHFDGYIEDDKLRFDYKLKPGICESFNALVLMKKMGIDLDSE